MSKFTPGPWSLGPREINAYIPVKSGTITIAHVPDTGDWAESLEESYANAHLIEAAPDLYKELKHLVALLEPHLINLRIPGLATLNGANAALAKVEGRA